MRIAVPFGFYGWGNIGDESTLQGFARLLASYSRIDLRTWVASRNPAHTARVEPSFQYYDATSFNIHGWLARRRALAYVFAGGTPVADILGSYPLAEVAPIVTTGSRRGKHILFVGVGTESLHRKESRLMISETLAPRVHRWSVRSQRDKDRLMQCGVRGDSITIAADMAWLLDPVSSAWGGEYLRSLGIDTQKRLIGVNVNNEPFMQKEAPDLLQNVGRFLDELIEKQDATVLFLCNDSSEGSSYDRAASLAVRSAMRNGSLTSIVPNHYWSPQQMLSLIACCRMTLSSRYHFCLFSALQRIPFIALQRSDKVTDLCWDLHWTQGVFMRAATPSALLDLYNDIEQKHPSLIALLEMGMQHMRERALKNSDPLDSLISGASR